MAQVVTIDGNVIPDADLRARPVSKNVAEYSNNLIASEMDIVLDNTDGSYSDNNVDSIFYATEWVDKSVTIYDDELNIYIWQGRIKNIIQDDGPRTVTVRTANFVRDLVDVTCVIAKTAKTPAEVIYNILTDLVQIDVSYIQYSGFQDAIARQTAAGKTCAVTFTSDDNKNCMSVIQELQRMSNCVLYTSNGKFCLWQWRAWDGAIGRRITSEFVIPGSFRSEYDFTVYNSYAIYYNNSGTATKQEVNKVGTDGEKKFVVPDENVESTTPGNFRILYDSVTGADAAGVEAYTRYANPTKKCAFEMDEAMRDLDVNEQIDLFFGDYTGEPVRLTSVEYDPNSRRVRVEGVFLNLPVNVVTRDEEAPTSPVLMEVLPAHRGIYVKWGAVTDADLLGYYIYIAVGSEGQWHTVMTNFGPSPVECKNPATTIDGLCGLYITELTPGATYYVKVTAFDTSFNESEDSNVMSCATLPYVTDEENLYCCDGDLYEDGITLDVSNSREGYVPADGDFSLYGGGYYDTLLYEVTAIYESLILCLGPATLINELTLRGSADSVDDIKVQWAEYDPVTDTLGAWSTPVSCVGTCILNPAVLYLMLRIIFYSPNWSDPDRVAVIGMD